MVIGLQYRRWLAYGRWVVRCTSQRYSERWYAVVDVWQSGGDTKRVPFSVMFDNPGNACIAGLDAGRRWIEARPEDRAGRLHDRCGRGRHAFRVRSAL